MKQIEKDRLCAWCNGCNKLEIEEFEGVRNCANFAPCFENWQDEYRKALLKEKK